MSKVSDKEVFEMLGMFVSGKSVTEISKAVGRSKPTVEKYISELKKEQAEQAEQEAELTESDEIEPKKEYTGRKNTTMFIKKTGAKNNSGVAVMTGEESSRSDATRGASAAGAKNPKYVKTIHQINND